MILLFKPQKNLSVSVSDLIEVHSENVLAINSQIYRADLSLVCIDPSGPVLSGSRDASGLLTLVLRVNYCSADASLWETSDNPESCRGHEAEHWLPMEEIYVGEAIELTGKTQAQLEAADIILRIVELKAELQSLDVISPRGLEDLYLATGQTPYSTVQTAIDRKNEIRAQIKKLGG